MTETCTWLIEVTEPDEYDVDTLVDSHLCGKRAVVVYVKRNPRHKEPDQPEMLRYPRCKIHDTNEARRVAPAQGYDIQEVENDAR